MACVPAPGRGCVSSAGTSWVHLHSKETQRFQKSNRKYKHNLPCEMRASSSRHLNAREGRSDVVPHPRHCGIQQGEDTVPPEGNQCQQKKVRFNLAFAGRSPAHMGENSRKSCWCCRAPTAGRWRVVSLPQQAQGVFWKMGFPCSWCLTTSLGAQLLLPPSWPNPDSVNEREVSFTEVKHISAV